MSQQKVANQQVTAVGVAAAAAVAAAVIPMIATRHTTAGGELSPDVALTSSALSDVPSLADVDLGGAFNLDGLLHAEVAAGEALFNGVIGIPGSLVGDAVSGAEGAINDAIDLNFGDAFSSLTGIPPAVAGTLLGAASLPLGVYNMALVIPGEYLFNFGGDPGDTTTDPSPTAAALGDPDLASILSSFDGGDGGDFGSILGDLTGGLL